MEGLSSLDDYALSTMQDFNLEHSFEVSDLTASNFSAVSKKNLSGVSHENLIASENLTDFGNFTDISNLAAVCGLTITNQSLKIVQVNWFTLFLKHTFQMLDPNIFPCVNVPIWFKMFFCFFYKVLSMVVVM